MPMMAVSEQNDARYAARLLAVTTLREIEASDGTMAAHVEETVAVNMFRLLDDYRAHQFYGIEDGEALDDEFSPTSMLPLGERHMAELRTALERTITDLGRDRDSLIDEVEGVLRAATYPEMDEIRPGALDLTKRFFQRLIGNLQLAGA